MFQDSQIDVESIMRRLALTNDEGHSVQLSVENDPKTETRLRWYFKWVDADGKAYIERDSTLHNLLWRVAAKNYRVFKKVFVDSENQSADSLPLFAGGAE